MMLHVDGISMKWRKKENSNITLPGLFYALKGSSHVKCLEDYLANNEHLISFIYDYYLNQYYLWYWASLVVQAVICYYQMLVNIFIYYSFSFPMAVLLKIWYAFSSPEDHVKMQILSW